MTKPRRRQNRPTDPGEGIREGLEDLAAGRVAVFTTAKALIADLQRHTRKRARRQRR